MFVEIGCESSFLTEAESNNGARAPIAARRIEDEIDFRLRGCSCHISIVAKMFAKMTTKLREGIELKVIHLNAMGRKTYEDKRRQWGRWLKSALKFAWVNLALALGGLLVLFMIGNCRSTADEFFYWHPAWKEQHPWMWESGHWDRLLIGGLFNGWIVAAVTFGIVWSVREERRQKEEADRRFDREAWYQQEIERLRDALARKKGEYEQLRSEYELLWSQKSGITGLQSLGDSQDEG